MKRHAEKLSIAPFRCAPGAITGCGESGCLGWENGICDATGLHIRVGGFLFVEDQARSTTILPTTFTIVSTDTGKVYGKTSGDSPQDKTLSLQRRSALIIKPDRGFVVTNANAAVVLIEEATGSPPNTNRGEIMCKIVGYLDFLPTDHVTEVVFPVKVVEEGQGCCVT